jgi:hypothetical protein
MKVLFMLSTLLYFMCACNQSDQASNNSSDLPDDNHFKSSVQISNDSDSIKEVSADTLTQKIIRHENVLEVFQHFRDSDLVSTPVAIDLINTEGAMLSAYSLDKGLYQIYFRSQVNNQWSDWIELHENHEVNNPERNVFAPIAVPNEATFLQFKSNQNISKEVVFRTYIFS